MDVDWVDDVVVDAACLEDPAEADEASVALVKLKPSGKS